MSLLGDTPGSLGYNDHADPALPKASPTGLVARTADGTAVAVSLGQTTANQDSGPFVDPDYATITSSVGDGFCVPLVQLHTKVGHTSTWKAGDKLADQPALKEGTAIATFNKNGVYESKARGNHAAFFVRYETRKDGTKKDVKGIVIYDQYREWPDKEQKAIKALEGHLQDLEKKLGLSVQSKSDLEGLRKELDDVRAKLAAANTELEKSYAEVDGKNRRFRRKQPSERFVSFDHGGSPSNDASAYAVIVH